jgi:hypothetical protein
MAWKNWVSPSYDLMAIPPMGCQPPWMASFTWRVRSDGDSDSRMMYSITVVVPFGMG